ncbi:MAG: hypothetical protein ABFD66_15665 [Smithella sp.]
MVGEALNVWRNKLDFLQVEEAKASDPTQKFSIAEQIKEAKSKIAELENAILTKKPDDHFSLSVDISRIDKYAPVELIGRDTELALLYDAWEKVQNKEPKRPHVLTFVALGGEGKTSLVAKWMAELAGRDWPGCEAAFAWSFYSRGTSDQNMASSDIFFKEALTFFGDKEMAQSPQGAYEKGKRLARLVGERRALLILDGLEPLQYAPTSSMPSELKDSGIAALLKGLAATSCGLCIVTTRYSIPDLRAFRQNTAPEIELLRLSRIAGVHLLQSLGVRGSYFSNIPSNDDKEMLNEFEKLVEDVKGHALTLNLLGSYLRDCHDGDIRCRDLIKLEEADAEEQSGHAFRVMDAYVSSFENSGKTVEDKAKGRLALAILRIMGLFDRPASADCLDALWKNRFIPGLTDPFRRISDAQRNKALTRLEVAKLLSINRDVAGRLISLDTHPLVREYFARQLREKNPAAWRAGHRRLFEHLMKTTYEGNKPTLEALQPLYQAVAHGCHAGRQGEAFEKVYKKRILRGYEGYSMFKLGAFGSDLGALVCFFEIPWSTISSALNNDDQAWLLNQVAVILRALGRLTEAIEPMQAAAEWALRKQNWVNAGLGADNLSKLELMLGEVARAVTNSDKGITYTDRCDNIFNRIAVRTTHAYTLYQAGHCTEAEKFFHEAEIMQAKHYPHYPLLYSTLGFRYCELLLNNAEREAGKDEGVVKKEELFDSCRAVSERAAQTLKWAESASGVSLLDTATIHLMLGRAAFYKALLEKVNFQFPSEDISYIDLAVDNLRRARHQDHLPSGLLTRAWLRFVVGSRTGPESAQSDLDEAWEIAERGPMPLFMADIHLYRARLFFRKTEYPWGSPQYDLAEARRLIEKHGYWRRKEELEDAEAAIKKWLEDHR